MNNLERGRQNVKCRGVKLALNQHGEDKNALWKGKVYFVDKEKSAAVKWSETSSV
jgi:hypothetical protein